MRWTIERLKNARESEDKVEFKRAEGGNFAYDGGSRTKPAERRRCILGYVAALCNENGGSLVLGMEDKYPHKVVGTTQSINALGDLEAAIYRDVRIRPDVYELFENEETKSGRVLVIDVPPRPIGQVFKFEDVPLMRVGEELTPMSESQYRRIVEEQEPDFSERICEGVTIDDLDDDAIRVMKEKYAKKQNNQMFLTLPKERILSDLKLTAEGQVTYGALLLVGKAEIIARELPQAEIRVEYRNSLGKIPFDNRVVYMKPFFLMIDELWHDINLRNGSFPVNEGSYIFNVPYFNEEVIRESINNAVAHRDYRRQSETVIKLYPQQMTIVNAGGFPHGVTIENILTVPSTPRNRLLADVLAKTGIVERSGQGVDKIFYDTLSEGKKEPDYSKSDDFHVELTLSSVMHDQGFAIFIDSVQKGLPDEQKLSVHEIMTLVKIRDGENPARLDKSVVRNLLDRKLIEKRGKTKGTNYILCRSYFEYAGDIAAYARKSDWDENQMRMMVFSHLAKYQSAKMGDFVSLFEGHLNRRQVRDNILKMVKSKSLSITGTGSGTRYSISEDFKKGSEVLGEIFDLGLAEFNRRHDTGNVQKTAPNGS
jgi:ATP-dependent DNA helicase RecG